MKNIYLADDDEDDIDLFKQAALDVCPDLEITAVTDGSKLIQSLEVATPPKPDCIFLDINMPKMDGFACINALKTKKEFKDIPVIVYSTSGMHSDISKMYAAGADLYITKPMNFSGLKGILEIVCNLEFNKDYVRTSFNNFHFNA